LPESREELAAFWLLPVPAAWPADRRGPARPGGRSGARGHPQGGTSAPVRPCAWHRTWPQPAAPGPATGSRPFRPV